MRANIREDEKYKIDIETDTNEYMLFKKESDDQWTIRGVYKQLSKAEDAIKRLETAKKKKVEPLLAYKEGVYGAKTVKVKVTSMIDSKYSWQTEVWTSEEDSKTRSKESPKHLLKRTQENLDIIQKADELQKQAKEVRKGLVYWTKEEMKQHFRPEEGTEEGAKNE